ncbi:glycosyltransferase [Pseudomonas sp. UBA2684]|uniref:glycosyltransferase n=1 Tax=Pseudomonas sp. UBA2684 TaxID=1947311 RepID=UPI000E7EC358|nr:glycosyltransferase [Pseudomonas sp. UBA2684]HBX55226.1 glycosyltransferase [Pseudomonas sp.]|tara:strand:- start:14971 stop:16449 length:1479 start_codon:yes stop_codon:yes gene_type:complete
MIILVGSKIDQASIQGSLGKPEYSYFFLMKDFLPALERLGRVLLVKSTEEIDRLYEQHRAAGEEVVFFSFSPPHQAPLGLSCPTVVVFAWEFDSLPSVAWDGNPQNDWRYALANLQGAICTSRETAGLVEHAMPDGFPVIALPAPVWDRYAYLGSPDGLPIELGEREFPFAGIVIDSPTLGLSADGLVRKPEPVVEPPEPEIERLLLSGAPRHLIWPLSKALFKGWWREMRQPLGPLLNAPLPVEAVAPQDPAAAPKPQLLSVSGVVYTTVLNPADGRKNWVDLVTAFCWAFKYTENATLLLKMTHHDLEHYRIVLMTLLSRLAPFRCRVLVLHGFLEDTQYREFIRASTYYVNASSCEGLCLPLMEFLSSAKPVIAPKHTAMADYLNDQLAFVLQTSLEPTCWPHDPTGMMFTHKHRLNWQSLVEAFRDSHQVALSDPARYQAMSRSAYQQMQHFAAVESVSEPLMRFLDEVLLSASKPSQDLRIDRSLAE